MAKPLPGVDSFFRFCWKDLSDAHKALLIDCCQPHSFEKGELILPYNGECLGLVMVQNGQFRSFVLSEGGKEVTLDRLFSLDICLFSAMCVFNNAQFNVQIQAEQDTKTLILPSRYYQQLINQSTAIANYTNELMAGRLSDVMWTLEQVLFKSMDSRIAQALLDYAGIAGSTELTITHESIARDLGTAREVVTRMLKYFSNEQLLSLSRGRIKLLNIKRLQEIAG